VLMQGTMRHMGFIAFLLVSLTLLHYVSPRIAHDRYHLQIIFQRLYFLPIMLGCLWFDLRGGLITFCVVFLLLIPHLVSHWAGMAPDDLTRIMQIAVYLVIAVVLGKVVSLRKREQSKAKQAENLAAIGRSLSAVAHDMKTPLVAIGGFANLIKRHLPAGNPDGCKLDIIINETARLEGMVKDMLDFSRPLDLNRIEVDIYSMINECVAIVENAKSQKVSIQAKLADNLPAVSLDSIRIRQALINLLTNAVQASPEGDTVTLHCYRKGKNLFLDVIDCGCGIPLELREAIFSPFFTTKKDGTGLGLPIVKKIVDAHGGFLEIIDNPCKGLTFRMIIPSQIPPAWPKVSDC
jgi:two-component system, NtrC family, sensor histidine kinase HydH